MNRKKYARYEFKDDDGLIIRAVDFHLNASKWSSLPGDLRTVFENVSREWTLKHGKDGIKVIRPAEILLPHISCPGWQLKYHGVHRPAKIY